MLDGKNAAGMNRQKHPISWVLNTNIALKWEIFRSHNKQCCYRTNRNGIKLYIKIGMRAQFCFLGTLRFPHTANKWQEKR